MPSRIFAPAASRGPPCSCPNRARGARGDERLAQRVERGSVGRLLATYQPLGLEAREDLVGAHPPHARLLGELAGSGATRATRQHPEDRLPVGAARRALASSSSRPCASSGAGCSSRRPSAASADIAGASPAGTHSSAATSASCSACARCQSAAAAGGRASRRRGGGGGNAERAGRRLQSLIFGHHTIECLQPRAHFAVDLGEEIFSHSVSSLGLTADERR
jgi:hypothetical protein